METSAAVGVIERWPAYEARDEHATEIDMGVAVGRMRIRTADKVGVTDLTPRIESFLEAVRLEAGWVNVQARHPTTGICVNESETLPLGDLLLRTAETLDVARSRLQLGRRQRVLLVELDGPREREVSLLAMGERRR
jgi:thiamine phosphate synthase YjbQ (UPF0047 family)